MSEIEKREETPRPDELTDEEKQDLRSAIQEASELFRRKLDQEKDGEGVVRRTIQVDLPEQER